MSARWFLAACTLLALLAVLATSDSQVGAQDKKKKADPDKATSKPDPKKPDLKAIEAETIELLKSISEAAQKNDFRKDGIYGNGDTPYEDYPKTPGLLVGLTIYPGLDGKNAYVRGVRPIYVRRDGTAGKGTIKSDGHTFGWVGAGAGAAKVEARPGYAVGGVKMHTHFGMVVGMSLVFYKITETGLDKDDKYESRWYGSKDPTTARLAGGTGEPILGIHGKVEKEARSKDFGFGLIIMGKAKKK